MLKLKFIQMLLRGIYTFAFVVLILPLDVFANEALRHRIEGWGAGYSPQIYGRVIWNAGPLANFYEEQHFQPLWIESQKLNLSAQELIRFIATVEGDGLLPEDYHYSLFKQLEYNQNITDVAEYELLMSDAFLTLAHHLVAGKVNPELLTSEWKVRKRQVDAQLLLKWLSEKQELTDILRSLLPKHLRYERLKEALASLKLQESDEWQVLVVSPIIRPGMTDSRVPEIKRRLNLWGDLEDLDSTDIFDAQTEEAVSKFQYRNGLQMDGILGKDTIKTLNISFTDRIKDVTVNLERWRWLEEFMGDPFLVVNIAAFDLRMYANNEVVLQKPIIVGRNYRKTPVFSDTIRYLVFNPTWTVPHKLAVLDKLPEIQKDPGYLSKLGFTVYHAGTSDVADPESIEWAGLSKNNFPYRLVQAPGPLNALGQVKFMFPNAYDVYLHDTSARELFKKTERAFSSGCIRVSDPIELAEILLAKQGWDKERIQSVLDSGKTTTVYLEVPIPVHLEYWTAWVDRVGKLNFRGDIYNRDRAVWNALNQLMQ